MHFLRTVIAFVALTIAAAPAALAQPATPTPEYLRAIDAYIAQREGLKDGSYVFVGYASDDLDNAEIILPREVFAQMVGNMVVMGDLPPEKVEALARAVRQKSRAQAAAYEPALEKLRERRAEIAAIVEGSSTAQAPPPPSRSSLIERARVAAGASPAVTAGSSTGRALPWNRATAAPPPRPVDGSIEVPGLPQRPIDAPSPFTDWMTGTFDNDRNVFTLNRGSGSYLYANGTMTAERIDGTVVEGRWTQSSSGQQCKDGGYHGRFRITFTEDGFSGLFGYCDEPPGAPGGFQGRRRK